jgi:hypothetical protein
MECLGLHNKPKAEVHSGHKKAGPEEEEVLKEIRCVDTNMKVNYTIVFMQL